MKQTQPEASGGPRETKHEMIDMGWYIRVPMDHGTYMFSKCHKVPIVEWNDEKICGKCLSKIKSPQISILNPKSESTREAANMVKHMKHISSGQIHGVARNEKGKYQPEEEMEIPEWLKS